MQNHVELVQPVIKTRRDANLPSLDAKVVEQEIEKALHHVEQIDSRKVRVVIEDNCVRLRGDVKTWREHEAAGKAAAAIKGVRKVDNDLRVAPWLF